jgi:hypothetical protein
MTFEQEGYGAVSPEEALLVAEAIADRLDAFSEVSSRIGAELYGEEYVEMSGDLRRAYHLGRATMMLARIESPKLSISRGDYVAAFGEGAIFGDQAQKFGEFSGVSVSAEDMSGFSRVIAEDVETNSGLDGDATAELFSNELVACKSMAIKYGVSLEKVYRTDDYYYEACRLALPASEAADKSISLINAPTEDTFTKLAIHMIDTMLPKEVLDNLPPGEKEVMCMEIQVNPEIRVELGKQVALMQERTRQILFYDFFLTYGYDRFYEELSGEQRDNLLPKMNMTKPVVDAVHEAA